MESSRILAIVLLAVLHFILAGMLLDDLANRKKVLGKRKAPWVIIILLVAYIGVILYLLCHPKIFYGENNE